MYLITRLRKFVSFYCQIQNGPRYVISFTTIIKNNSEKENY